MKAKVPNQLRAKRQNQPKPRLRKVPKLAKRPRAQKAAKGVKKERKAKSIKLCNINFFLCLSTYTVRVLITEQ